MFTLVKSTLVDANIGSSASGCMPQREGTIAIRMNIQENGNVSKVEPATGRPRLILAAIDAVKQRKYQLYLLNQPRSRRKPRWSSNLSFRVGLHTPDCL